MAVATIDKSTGKMEVKDRFWIQPILGDLGYKIGGHQSTWGCIYNYTYNLTMCIIIYIYIQ
jgi:hypothetical protein